MIEGCEIIEVAPHAWSAENHDGIQGCYFCKPQSFPAMPEFQTLCCRCGNLIRIPTLDPMNLGMEACSTCADEINADSINTQEKEGDK